MYKVLSEFWSLWGENVDENTTVTLDEVKRLSYEWDKTVEELLEQL